MIKKIAQEKIEKYFEIQIEASPSGFGMYESRRPEGESWGSLSDLLMEIRDNLREEFFELGKDILPDGLEDIRGRIENEPAMIFGYFDEENHPRYFGISNA